MAPSAGYASSPTASPKNSYSYVKSTNANDDIPAGSIPSTAHSSSATAKGAFTTPNKNVSECFIFVCNIIMRHIKVLNTNTIRMMSSLCYVVIGCTIWSRCWCQQPPGESTLPIIS